MVRQTEQVITIGFALLYSTDQRFIEHLLCSLQTQLNSRLSYLPGHTHASVLRMLSGGVSVDKTDWLLPETRKRFDDQANRLRQRKEGIIHSILK